jgi:hypothetical protein
MSPTSVYADDLKSSSISDQKIPHKSGIPRPPGHVKMSAWNEKTKSWDHYWVKEQGITITP